MAEEWRPIPGHEGYYWLSNIGEVKNSEGKKIAHVNCGNGNFKVKLQSNGQREERYISSLLAEVFPELEV